MRKGSGKAALLRTRDEEWYGTRLGSKQGPKQEKPLSVYWK